MSAAIQNNIHCLCSYWVILTYCRWLTCVLLRGISSLLREQEQLLDTCSVKHKTLLICQGRSTNLHCAGIWCLRWCRFKYISQTSATFKLFTLPFEVLLSFVFMLTINYYICQTRISMIMNCCMIRQNTMLSLATVILWFINMVLF
jgi:hypothetical protein